MTINTKELQQFYNVWGPMIASLPAIINAVEHESELQNSVDHLQSLVVAAQAESVQILADRAAGLADIDTQMQEFSAKKCEATQAANAHEKACTARIGAASAACDVEIASQVSRTESAVAKANEVAEDLRVKMAEADEQHSAHAAVLQQQTDELEAKRKTAEEALDILRKKLG